MNVVESSNSNASMPGTKQLPQGKSENAKKKDFYTRSQIAKIALQVLAIVGAGIAGAVIAATLSFSVAPIAIGALIGVAVGVSVVSLYHVFKKGSPDPGEPSVSSAVPGQRGKTPSPSNSSTQGPQENTNPSTIPDAEAPIENAQKDFIQKLRDYTFDANGLFNSDLLVHTDPDFVVPSQALAGYFKDIRCAGHTIVNVPTGAEIIHANELAMPDGNTYIASHYPRSPENFYKVAVMDGGLIVNLLQEKEAENYQYYPKEVGDSKTYGDCTVKNIDVQNVGVSDADGNPGSELVLYKLEITIPDRDNACTLQVLHYNQWVDFGVPENSPNSPIENLFKKVDKYGNAKPTIVHCRGGIGRTGTFITSRTNRKLIDQALKKSERWTGEDIVKHTIENINIGRKGRDKNYVQTFGQLNFVLQSTRDYLIELLE